MNRMPPPPGVVKNVQYPKATEDRLGNGMQWICVEDHQLPRVTVAMAFPSGRRSDPADLRGLTQIATEMLKEGTGRLDSREIAELLDRLAIDFGSEVAMEHTIFTMTQLVTSLDPALELLADCIRDPSFPEKELEKVRVRWHSHLIAQRSDPGFLANERLADHMFGAHPYSRTSIPLQNLALIGRPELSRFYREMFQADRASLLFAGAISPSEAAKLAERCFGDWDSPGSAGPEADIPLEWPERRTVQLVHRPNSVQTKFLVGIPGLPRRDPAYLKLKLANQVFGGGASSRFFLNLREEKGYTYGAYSSMQSYRLAGVISAGANVRTEVTSEALAETFRELEGMRTNPATDEELRRGKSELTGAFIRRLETAASVGYLELTRRLNGLSEDYYARLIPGLESIRRDDVLEVASRILNLDQATIVAVGERDSLEAQLSELGPLSVYDVVGNRVS